MSVRLTIYCGSCNEVIGVYNDLIDEKYPFWCDGCGDYCRTGSYPWRITTEIITETSEQGET
jgi:hypothetical protein